MIYLLFFFLEKVRNVSLLINGFDQNPIERINKSVINRKTIPIRRPKTSPNPPTIKGTTAPPTIPVTSIPEKEPWASATEFKANEIIIDHIVAIKKPMAGKAIKACALFPKRAINNAKIEAVEVTIRTFLLSKNFKRTSPKSVPKVIIPQKLETVLAPWT